MKSPSIKNNDIGSAKNHHSFRFESGSESEDEPRSKNKYFKAREKEREIQRRKGILFDLWLSYLIVSYSLKYFLSVQNI